MRDMTTVGERAARVVVAIGLVILTMAVGSAQSTGSAVLTSSAPGQTLVLSRAEAAARARMLASIGRRMFVDPALSASGRMSCATCHSATRAFGPPNDRPVQFGGVALDQPGVRAVPSLRYLQTAPAFIEHYFESPEEGDESTDAGPTGGLNWDGRIDRGRDQVLVPLFSPFEMANADAATLARSVARAPYAADLRAAFGDDLFANPDAVVRAIGEAFEAYEQTPAEFFPYTSKFDAVMRGQMAFTPQERRGFALFEDPAKGDCARCHFSVMGRNFELPQFTDFSLIALGVPRNSAIPANGDPGYYDLGMCGPLRTDLATRPEYCGLFMTPTLRNAATREAFFHNGVFHTLREVVQFYAERDTNPEKWYPVDADGRVKKFDDLPAAYRANVEMETPFGGQPGDSPPLTSDDIDDIVAFIETLTDGWRGE